MSTINDCADYIILKVTEDKASLNLLKLQKLAYYAQAWHLAFYNRPLFPGTFEAWVHGPVSRDLYRRFAGVKTMYATITHQDISVGFNIARLTEAERIHIDNVLEAYAGLTGSQLEDLSHREEPWLRARGGLPASESSNAAIDEGVMATFYQRQMQTPG